MNRRIFINKTAQTALGLLGTGLIGGCLPGISKNQPRESRPPNVLFLFTDDQRFDTIGALGNPEIITPNMDHLVREGTAFTNAYIMGAMSGAVCMPSRAMLLTGQSLWSLEKDGASVPQTQTTLPEAFRTAGYHTFFTGKWHQDKACFARGFTDAKAVMFGGMSSHYKVPLHDFDPSGCYPADKRYFRPTEHSSDIFAESAAAFLETADPDRPFFAMAAFTAPHDPRHMPRKYLDMYKQDSLSIPPSFLPEHPFDNGELDIRDEQLGPRPRTPDQVREHKRDYYAMITHLDAKIGELLAILEHRGLTENTLIVLSSDNGLAVGRHGLMGKQNLYEHSVKVPLVFAGPGVKKSARRSELCYLQDIFPTLCEASGLSSPSGIEGLSLWPAIQGRPIPARKAVVFAYKNFQRGIRTGDWKLIVYNVRGRSHEQLFDLRKDPWETANLLESSPCCPPSAFYLEHTAKLKALLQKELTRLGDPARLDEPHWGVDEIPPWTCPGCTWPTKYDDLPPEE